MSREYETDIDYAGDEIFELPAVDFDECAHCCGTGKVCVTCSRPLKRCECALNVKEAVDCTPCSGTGADE